MLARIRTPEPTDCRVLGTTQHDGLKNNVQTFHGHTSATLLDQRRDTSTEHLPVVEWPSTEELEERVELLDIVLNWRTRETPAIFGAQFDCCLGSLRLVILNVLSLVDNNTEPLEIKQCVFGLGLGLGCAAPGWCVTVAVFVRLGRWLGLGECIKLGRENLEGGDNNVVLFKLLAS